VFAPLHYDLEFSFPKDSNVVSVVSRQTYLNTTGAPLDTLVLDAHDLKVSVIEVVTAPHKPLGPPPVGVDAAVPDFVAHVAELNSLATAACKYDYDTETRKITLTLSPPIAPGAEVVVRTASTCAPDDKELEGIYFDFTPPGKPQTMISQCQQYGFQRIVPCIDTMNSKTFYTTRITASDEYTNIVSNGDLQGEYVKEADGRKTATYYNHKVNMAPYLFFIGVGTYDTYVSEVEYPSGKSFRVELLALPGVIDKPEDAESALVSLVDSVIWTCVSCGPEKYEHETERARIYELLPQRDALKKSSPDSSELVAIRAELAKLISVWSETGYTYTGTCYREIGMENSNYGGMENVGNTTILSSRLTPSRWLVDGGHVYMEGVKVHEFYHNINGSQVTGDTPFEIWLNEAVTVHVQREREDAIFGHDYMRLGEVIYARMPGNGPLALDRAPSSMAVEPAGFNTTHELISAMTYSKAPEFVKMTQTLIGEANFVKALANYYRKYAFSNATSGQWVDEMAAFQPAGVDLKKMAKGWLQRTSYPSVTVESRTNLNVKLKQTGFEGKKDDDSPWIIPVVWSAVKDGKSVASGMWVFQTAEEDFTVTGVSSEADFDFVSIGCDWSFYGDITDKSQTVDQRLKQAMTDPDTVNRYLAFQAVVDEEKAKLVQSFRSGVTDGLIGVSDSLVDLYGSVLNDSSLSDATKARFLAISDDVPSRPELGHLYWHLSMAKKAILQAVGAKYEAKLASEFARLAADSQLTTRPLKQAVFAAMRAAKSAPQVVGGVQSAAEEERVEEGRVECCALLQPLMSSDFMSDRAFAFISLLELGGAEGAQAKVDAKAVWCKHSIGTEQYISSIAAADTEDTPANIRELLEEPFFNMALAGHARTCARAWCSNRKRALLTKEGLELTQELFVKVGKVNQMSAYGFIGTFGQVKAFDDSVKAVLVQALKSMRENIKDEESLFNQLGRLISGVE
jgi:aminopeptidase N